MLRTAKDRKMTATAVLFDSWYAAAHTMKAVRKLGWHWVTKMYPIVWTAK
ncbi:MAG: hypothetical protein EAZ92_16155 [Candidatus Kapaibacterium sp.]|nr:MAG: hypothetical protein EAZ92_16155 [Candidatus Kapabacteria bacterium]